ncbi:MAG: YlxR family protein [Clostridium sp.]|nr:YlxR family protein [Clostridium sp.]MCM1172643.1 YlxR family protein [Clostridium sp.]MCM1207696.1 YlxR family protein [Ruminococcus sp.]
MAKKIPQRQCLGCRQMKPKNELVRIIRTSLDEIKLDVTGKMNGRGAYICREKACFDKAVKSKAVDRALNMEVPEEIYLSIGRELI